MFRKVLFLLLLFVGVVFLGVIKAQNTAPTSTDFDITAPNSNDVRLRLASSPYFMADNRYGTLVNSWSTNASTDSANSYSGGKDLYWVMSFETFGTKDSIAAMRIDEFTTDSVKARATYRDSINWKGWPQIHSEANFGSLPIGLNVTVCATSSIAGLSFTERAKWKWYLYLSHTSKAFSTTSGSLATHQRPDTLSKKVILDSDTLAIADTTYSSAIPGNFGYVSLFITDQSFKPDSSIRAFLGYQIKYNGGSWAGPLDTFLYAFPVLDSLLVDSVETRSYWTSTTPADSIRFTLFNKTMGRIKMTLKALWRD